jgi:hypothetical protein
MPHLINAVITAMQGNLKWDRQRVKINIQYSQEERSIFWEVIVLVILSKKVYKFMCPIANSFCDSYFMLSST